MVDKVRKKADELYYHFATLFDVPEGDCFAQVFETRVLEFREVTKDLDKLAVMQLVEDPTLA